MSVDFSSKIYVSAAHRSFDDWALKELAEFSAHMNAKFGITGYLVYLDGRFVQYFEGAKSPVEQLMSNIRNDERHEILQETGEAHLVTRRFPTWFMRWLHHEELAQVKLERDLATLLLSRKEMETTIWEARLWLTVERVLALDHKLKKNKKD